MTTPATTITLDRVFKMGSVELPDPAPDKAPEDALKLFVPSYPHLASATLAPPVAEGDRLVFAIEKPPVATKG